MYAVSKTALLGLTKGLAAELGPEGITVNCVAPGVVPTKFSAALVANPELVRAVRAVHAGVQSICKMMDACYYHVDYVMASWFHVDAPCCLCHPALLFSCDDGAQ